MQAVKVQQAFWQERLGHQPDRAEQAREFARMIEQDGLTLQAIATLVGLSFQRVSKILQVEGVKPERLRPGRPRRSTQNGWYTVSDRLLKALRQFPDRTVSIQEGLRHFAAKPDSLVLEAVGMAEQPVSCRVGLTEVDLALISQLGQQFERPNQSAVIRNCIEYLIERYALANYRKPSDWQSRPLSLRQGGQNPNPGLVAPLSVKTWRLPLSLWQRLEACSFAAACSIATVARTAIEQADLSTLEPLTPEEESEAFTSRTIRLFVSQREWLQQQLPLGRISTENALLLAVIKQHLHREGG